MGHERRSEIETHRRFRHPYFKKFLNGSKTAGWVADRQTD